MNSVYRYLFENLQRYNIDKKEIINDLLIEILEHMIEYIDMNILQMIYYDLYDEIYTYCETIFVKDYNILETISIITNLSLEESNKFFKTHLKIARNFIFKFVIPKRSYPGTFIRDKNRNKRKINEIILYIKSIKQPEQKSDEWYIFRNSTLTASNIWKIFGSDYSQTQLILEKCQTLDLNKFKNLDESSPMHWGQKYEPISIMYYEKINNTIVSEFGCIKHNKYEYIAASPDGIVCEPDSKLYGRMLEIKNVVSREITGIPKMEYWIQMQIQMEVCDLNECDFLETKMGEYESYEDYLEDIDREYKGIILQFRDDTTIKYEYCPLDIRDISTNEYKEWEVKAMEDNKELRFTKHIYWRLEYVSCILVLRNNLWFNRIQPLIESFWDNLQHEKKTELYKERIPKKKFQEIDDMKEREGFKPGCLIDVNNVELNEPEVETNNEKVSNLSPEIFEKLTEPKKKIKKINYSSQNIIINVETETNY